MPCHPARALAPLPSRRPGTAAGPLAWGWLPRGWTHGGEEPAGLLWGSGTWAGHSARMSTYPGAHPQHCSGHPASRPGGPTSVRCMPRNAQPGADAWGLVTGSVLLTLAPRGRLGWKDMAQLRGLLALGERVQWVGRWLGCGLKLFHPSFLPPSSQSPTDWVGFLMEEMVQQNVGNCKPVPNFWGPEV